MKALAIDSSITQLTISAKNDDHQVSAIYNIGMKQSETLLPAISYILEKAGINANELEYTTLCEGPGSFTGLRLAYAALKALQLANGTPVYGVQTTYAYAHPYLDLPFEVLSVVDAKKDRFYASSYKNKNQSLPEGDYEVKEVLQGLKDDVILICGPDAQLFIEETKKLNFHKQFITVPFVQNVGTTLFSIAEKMIEDKKEPIKDFDGPLYLRASEAEIKHNL